MSCRHQSLNSSSGCKCGELCVSSEVQVSNQIDNSRTAAANTAAPALNKYSLSSVSYGLHNDIQHNTLPAVDCNSDKSVKLDRIAAAAGSEDEAAASMSYVYHNMAQSSNVYGTDAVKLLVMQPKGELKSQGKKDTTIVHPSCKKFVQMPHCSEKWFKVHKVLNHLNSPVDSLQIVEHTVRQYVNFPKFLDFSGLEEYFVCGTHFQKGVLLELIPKIARLALEVRQLCSIPLLRQNKKFLVTVSQHQAACLLANAFFCTYPPTANDTLVHLNFIGLFRQPSDEFRDSQFAKLDCIFNYFQRVTSAIPTGSITFRRQVLNDGPKWRESSVKLVKDLRVSCYGRIEDDAPGMLHVDFANKYVGGGMLDQGCVQEEILFMLCPELIISRLLAEVLNDNETLVITGHQRFNSYTGYGRSFRWNGNYVDTTPCDVRNRHMTQLVVMDAQVLWNTNVYDQLSETCLTRELNKAFCGFQCPQSEQLCTVATGNWGCGAFGGDMAVKFLIQLMAASLAGRPLFYFTFDDVHFGQLIYQAHNEAVKANWSVGDLWNYMQDMAHDRHRLSPNLLLEGIAQHAYSPRSTRRSKTSCV